MYLLDADTLITCDNRFYPPKRFKVVWDWLVHHGEAGAIKIPFEQYEEIIVGRGHLVDFLKSKEVKAALLLDEEPDLATVQKVLSKGYADDLDDSELEEIGRDPFLVAYALVEKSRCVVSFETRAKKIRKNKKLPNVCDDFNVRCIDIFKMLEELDFSVNWVP